MNLHLELNRVGKSYKTARGNVQVLLDLDLGVSASEFVACVGPSGCGKSTLLKIIAGLISPSEGQVLVNQSPVSSPSSDRGIVFQDYSLFPWLTVRQNISFGLSLQGESKEVIREKQDYFLAKFDLADFADFFPIELSGGMKQRVAIARTLANEPSILLMDEPFGSLDAYTRIHMQNFLTSLVGQLKQTIVFVTHDINEAAYLSDRVIVFSHRPARIIGEIAVDLERPRHRDQIYTADFQRIVRDIFKLAEEWRLV